MCASIAAQGEQDSSKLAVEVKDRGTGLYELQFTLLQVFKLSPPCDHCAESSLLQWSYCEHSEAWKQLQEPAGRA